MFNRYGLFSVMELTEEGWTSASIESRWFRWGEDLARNCFETEDGMLVDRQGRLVHFR
jgi:hypothetical protein